MGSGEFILDDIQLTEFVVQAMVLHYTNTQHKAHLQDICQHVGSITISVTGTVNTFYRLCILCLPSRTFQTNHQFPVHRLHLFIVIITIFHYSVFFHYLQFFLHTRTSSVKLICKGVTLCVSVL